MWLEYGQVVVDTRNDLCLSSTLSLFACIAHQFDGASPVACARMSRRQSVQISRRTLGLGIERPLELRDRQRVFVLIRLNPAEMEMSERIRGVGIYGAPVQRCRLVPLPFLFANRA